MGPKEIEAVRAFCVYLRAAGMGEGWFASMTDEQVRTMIVVGDIIEKMRRGMAASAIATPSGPVLVEALKGGSFLVKRSHRSDRCEGKDLAVVLYEALVAAGGPLPDEPPSTLTVEAADALAGEIVTRLREGRDLGDLPDCGITIEETQREWMVTKDGESFAIPANAVDSWGRLRAEIARLLRE